MQDKYVIQGDTMARPSFNNLGLRRDLNLSDLPDKDTALSNLLNNLVTTDDGSTFENDDLLSAIEGISNTNVNNNSISKLAGLAVKNTVLNQETGELEDRVAQPLITAKNQIDTILATTNDPPFFNGGDGLFASFYEPDQILTESSITITTTGSQVLSGAALVTKKLWNNGFFEFTNKLDNTLGGANGAIQWNGFYIPDASGPSTFSFRSSGFIIVEMANEFGQLEIKKNVYKPQRTIYSTEPDLDGDRVITTTRQSNTVVVGDVLTAVFDDNGDPVQLPTDRQITVDAVGGGSVVFSEVLDELGIGANWRFDVDVSQIIGVNTFGFTVSLPELVRYIPVQVRITWWFPDEDAEYPAKELDVNLTTNARSSGDLPYWYLYTEVGDPQEVDEEGFKSFFDRRLLLGGGTIGPEDVIVSSQYNKWLSLKPLVLKYDPPRTYADAVRAVYRYGIDAGSNIVAVSTTNRFTDNLEIGNIVIADPIPQDSFITDISTNNIIIMNNVAEESDALDIVFMDHRGYLSSTLASSIGTQVTSFSGTAGLRVGTVVIAESATAGDYIRITRIINNTQFETSRALTLDGAERIYYYSDKGLQNRAYDNFCTGTIGTETTTTVSDGATILDLLSVDGINVNNVIQSTPYIPFDPDNNIITRIDAIEPVQDNKVELDLSNLVPGSGYTPNPGTLTYTNVALTGGTGTGATADITIIDGAVANATIVSRGSGYTHNDILSCNAADVGGTGSGFSVINSGIVPNSVQISNAIDHPNDKDMTAGITVVIAPNSTTQNKEVCFVPLNTAPPFVGTIDGLRTTDGNGSVVHLNLSAASAQLRVQSLKVENIANAIKVDATNPDRDYTTQIPIRCAGTDFTILGTTSGSTTS